MVKVNNNNKIFFRHYMVPLVYSTQGKDGILYMYNIENLIYI